MKAKLLIPIAVAAVLLIVLIFLMSGEESGGILDGPAGEFGRGDDVISRTGDEGFLSPRELERLVERGPSPEAMLESYRSYAQYPPNSRPLRRDMTDLINPWQIKNLPLPILNDPNLRTEEQLRKYVEELAAGGKSKEEVLQELDKRAKGAPRFVFELNKHTVTSDDTLEARLSVLDANGGPVGGVEILGAQLEGDPNFGKPGLGSVEFKENAGGGYVFTWEAPSGDKKYWGNLTLKVRARVPGLEGDSEVELQQSFYSSPMVPARFTGQFTDRLENGSLYIDAVLDVSRECRYSLHANLFSIEADEPTHWAAVDKVLSPGRQIVTFEFFGKIFRDNGYEGRFVLRDLRGTCENLPFPASWLEDPTKLKAIETAEPKKEPILLYIPYTDKTHTTRSYSFDDFSDEQWQSPDKDRRLRRLQELSGQ